MGPPPAAGAGPGARGVDIRVSYAARLGCTLAIGVTVMAFAVYILVASLLADSGSKPASTAGAPVVTCNDFTGEITCTDRMESGGKNYIWKVTEAGPYKITVKQDKPILRTLGIEKRDGGLIKFNAGDPGPDTVTSLTMAPGEYWVRVSDLTSTKKDQNQPFTLAVERVGARKPAASGSSPPSSGRATPMNPAFLATAVLGLVFLAIPLLFVAEKKRIPARIDERGVTMRSGALLPWSEYRGSRIHATRLRSGGVVETGLELLFARGGALLRYRPITNLQELAPIIAALKQNRNPFA